MLLEKKNSFLEFPWTPWITRGLPLEFYRRPCHIVDGAKPCETNQGLMFGDIYLGFCLLAWCFWKLWGQVYPMFFVLGQNCRIYRKPLISNCFNMEYWWILNGMFLFVSATNYGKVPLLWRWDGMGMKAGSMYICRFPNLGVYSPKSSKTRDFLVLKPMVLGILHLKKPSYDYPLVMSNIAMENRHAMKMGKLTISMAIFNSYFDITRGYRILSKEV